MFESNANSTLNAGEAYSIGATNARVLLRNNRPGATLETLKKREQIRQGVIQNCVGIVKRAPKNLPGSSQNQKSFIIGIPDINFINMEYGDLEVFVSPNRAPMDDVVTQMKVGETVAVYGYLIAIEKEPTLTGGKSIVVGLYAQRIIPLWESNAPIENDEKAKNAIKNLIQMSTHPGRELEYNTSEDPAFPANQSQTSNIIEKAENMLSDSKQKPTANICNDDVENNSDYNNIDVVSSGDNYEEDTNDRESTFFEPIEDELLSSQADHIVKTNAVPLFSDIPVSHNNNNFRFIADDIIQTPSVNYESDSCACFEVKEIKDLKAIGLREPMLKPF